MAEVQLDIVAIFAEALARKSVEERSRYLDEVCQNDPQMRERVEVLIHAHADAGGFLGGQSSGKAGALGKSIAEQPGTTIGNYKLLELIGEGGMGLVFMAEQAQPIRRRVALKILKPGMDTRQVIARFEAERQALALMEHPHIAKVFDAGCTDTGRPYFVMELVRGVPITEFCDQRRLSTRQRLELFVEVCQAVQHAHQKGIIHRDLKPSNVLVTLHDTVAVPKIIDFGIAKATTQTLTDRTLFTHFAQMIGTPLYMSPEQAEMNGLDADTRSDVYSLGVLLYELLTGTTPFTDEALKKAGLDEMRRLIREEEPPAPSQRLRTLDAQACSTVSEQRGVDGRRLGQLLRGELDWIVMKALEKDRDRRYETANALAVDVHRYLGNEPVLAYPPSAGYRLQKFLRRNKGTALAVILLFVALLAGTLGTTWGLLREAERAEGERQAKQAAIAAAEAEKQAKITAETVISFVESKIFAAARPKDQDGGQGYDVKLADAVKAALPFVDKNFTAQPLIEARLRMTMGMSFLDLGDAKTAMEQFQSARELYTKYLGADHPGTLQCMNLLATSYAALGRIQGALTLREETLRLRKANLGLDHPDTLRSMGNLAGSYADVGRNQEALELNEETLRLMKKKLGPSHPDTLRSMHNLINSYREVGRIQDAVKLGEESLPLMKANLGPNHPDTLTTMSDVASCYLDVGRNQDSIKLGERTLQLMKARLGADHLSTLRSMVNLANSYDVAGRSQEALKLREETFLLMKAKLGLKHFDTLKLMNNLACSYADAGRNEQALKLREETFQLMRAKLGHDHPDTLRSMVNLASSYDDIGRKQDALQLRERTLQLTRAKFGPDHPVTLVSMYNLANSYAATGRGQEALKLYEETLRLEKATLGPDHPKTLWSDYTVAECLVSVDRAREALPIIDDCLRRAQGKDVDPELIPGLHVLRFRHFQKIKDAAGCRANAEMWEKLGRTDSESLYQAACYRAMTAAVIREGKTPVAARAPEEQAENAMKWLKQAVAAGYADAAHMAKDADLDALRGREDFKTLFAAVEAKRKKSPAAKDSRRGLAGCL